MKKTKLTRSLMAACSIVALSAVMYGCVHSGGDDAPAEPVVDMPEPEPTPAELLAAAQTALADAQAALDAAFTHEELSAAYALLATAQAQVRAAAALPENQIAALNDSLRQLRIDLEEAQMLASQRDTVGTALRAAQSAVNGLSNDSSDEDVAAAEVAVTAAQTALAAATALPDDDALRTSVAAADTALDTAKAARTVHMQQGTVTAAVTDGADGGRRSVQHLFGRRRCGGADRGSWMRRMLLVQRMLSQQRIPCTRWSRVCTAISARP